MSTAKPESKIHMPLVDDDLKHLTAAQGFVELGMWLDANEELENIDPEVRHVPEVLAVRVGIYRALEKWELMQTVARKLAQYDPDDPEWTVEWAFATRRAKSLDAARLILENAIARLPHVAVFHFNLACYECQLGDVAAAKAHLQRAIELRGDLRLRALEDEDLKALWDSL